MRRHGSEQAETQAGEGAKRRRGDGGEGTGSSSDEEGTEVVEAEHGARRQRGIETELGGVRRSKRLAEQMEGGAEHDTEHAVAAEGRVEPVERHYLRRVPHLAGLGSAGAQLSTGFAASGKEASPLTMSARDT